MNKCTYVHLVFNIIKIVKFCLKTRCLPLLGSLLDNSVAGAYMELQELVPIRAKRHLTLLPKQPTSQWDKSKKNSAKSWAQSVLLRPLRPSCLKDEDQPAETALSFRQGLKLLRGNSRWPAHSAALKIQVTGITQALIRNSCRQEPKECLNPLYVSLKIAQR